MGQETVISAHDTGTDAQTATVATVRKVADRPLANLRHLAARLEVTQALDGTNPTLDVYLEREVGGGDWEDIYHFPQVTTSTVDKIVDLPLARSDADGSLATASRDVAVESLAADTLVGGHWGDRIRIREVIGGTVTQAAIYSVHMIGV